MERLPSEESSIAVSIQPSLAPTSDSVLSDAPASSTLEQSPSLPTNQPEQDDNDTISVAFKPPQISSQTESLLKRINTNAANAAASGTPGWEAAREQIMKDMATSDKFPTPQPARDMPTPKRGGRGGSRAGPAAGGVRTPATESSTAQTPGSSGRGRGRGGRPRGRGRGAWRGSKRKRGSDSDEDSDRSEEFTAPTMTKSGRSVQKPTSFVPPPPSPSNNKRRRPYRRNPESAVCKVCLRGTSPLNNMIVFCDGCNTAYHRYCHHPPIDQSVVDEVDKEWFCKQCVNERVIPVPEEDVEDFVSGSGASIAQRRRYFASLAPGMLVTLLTRATTLQPSLPLFPPEFQARAARNIALEPEASLNAQTFPLQTSTPGPVATPTAVPTPSASAHLSQFDNNELEWAEDDEAVPHNHPPNYPRPGHGLMKSLPPDQEDVQWLVDDDDRYSVFTHMYQTDSSAASAGLNGGG